MAQSYIVTLNTAWLLRKRLLTITPDFIDFKNKNFSKFEIAEIRYGLQPIHGLRTRIGRMYCIDVMSLSGKIIKIRFTVLYGIGRKKADGIYSSVVNILFENFFSEISEQYINAFFRNEEVALLGVKLTSKGLVLREKTDPVPWEDIGIRNYWSYCTIIVISNPSVYRSFTYLSDWNAIVLYSIMKYILKSKNLLETD